MAISYGGIERGWPPSGDASAPWRDRSRASRGCAVAPQSRGCGERDRRDVDAGVSWRERDDGVLRRVLVGAWESELSRATTDDDLLRFFTVSVTAGMLG